MGEKGVAMDVVGLGWCGTRTEHGAELAAFYRDVLRLRPVHQESGFWVFQLPDGSRVEVFDADTPGKEHFTTGPVVGFAVRDLPAAVAELRDAGVQLVGPHRETSQHFIGPDGHVYELVSAAPAEPVGPDAE